MSASEAEKVHVRVVDHVEAGELSGLWGIWLLSSLVALATVGDGTGRATLIAGCLLVISGIHLFVEHGGPRISGPGLVGISHAVFLGAPALYWLNEEPDSLGPALGFLLTFEYVMFVLMTLLFWRSWRQPLLSRPEKVDRRVTLSASLLFVVVAGLNLAGVGLVQVAVGVTALLLIGIALPISSWSLASLVRGFLMAAILLAFVGVVFTGRGRLVLVALMLSLAVVWSSFLTTRALKWAGVAMLPLVTAVLVRIREEGLNETDEGSDGLGSIVNPLRDFQAVRDWIDAGGDYGNGETLLATITLWIPRSMWEGKPVGFGRQLTEMLMPELLQIDQSLAALSAGEWYYNWGLLGLVAMALVIGVLVALVERAYVDALIRSGSSARSIATLTIWGVIIGGFPTLIWVGSFTFVERALQAVIPLLIVWFFAPAASEGEEPRVDRMS